MDKKAENYRKMQEYAAEVERLLLAIGSSDIDVSSFYDEYEVVFRLARNGKLRIPYKAWTSKCPTAGFRHGEHPARFEKYPELMRAFSNFATYVEGSDSETEERKMRLCRELSERRQRLDPLLAELIRTLPADAPIKELERVFSTSFVDYILWQLTLFARKFQVQFTPEQMATLNSVASASGFPDDWFSADESYLRKAIADEDEKRIRVHEDGARVELLQQWINRWKRRHAKPVPPLW